MNPPGSDFETRRSVVERGLRLVAGGCSFAFLLIISAVLLLPTLAWLGFMSLRARPPRRRAP
jgi:hypothetical protein